MEFVDGFPHFQLPSYIGEEHWQAVCDSDVLVVGKIGACGVLSKDINPKQNVKVRMARDDEKNYVSDCLQ